MTTPRFRDGVWLGMAWLVAWTSTGTDDPTAATAPTRLRLDVPAGLAVEIDGHSQGVTPLALLELPPGEHALAIDSPCGAVERTVTLAPHETTVFAELPTATLTVEARDRKAVRLPVTVTFGDWTIEGAAWTVPSGATVVPACAHRMRVSSPGLGGFVEDIELVADGALTRAVVLTPGPDVVRIHGGHFVSWDVETFDLDRHEVTVAQFLECYDKGGCKVDRKLSYEVSGPSFRDRPRCNIMWSIGDMDARWLVTAGKEDHPVNCVDPLGDPRVLRVARQAPAHRRGMVVCRQEPQDRAQRPLGRLERRLARARSHPRPGKQGTRPLGHGSGLLDSRRQLRARPV